MARYHAAVESRHAAAETFGYLATFSNAAEWDPGVLAGEQLDPGPVRAGSRFRRVVPFLGVRMPLTCEVIRFVPDREVLLHAANGVLRSTDRIVVTGAAGGSTVSYDAEVRLRGPLQVVDPILQPDFRGVAERAAAVLARAPSRVITVSSGGMYTQRLDLATLQLPASRYRGDRHGPTKAGTGRAG